MLITIIPFVYMMIFRRICSAVHYNPERVTIPEKIITISPGGFKGIYMFGVCTYIKEHYELSKYTFSGASAGAWNALLMSYKPLPDESIYNLNSRLFVNGEVDKIAKIPDIEFWLKNKILTLYSKSNSFINKLHEKYKNNKTNNMTHYDMYNEVNNWIRINNSFI